MYWTRMTVAASLTLILPALAAPTAPAAWCYTDNNKNPALTTPVPRGSALDDPKNYLEGPQGWMDVCTQNNIESLSFRVPDQSYYISYRPSAGDNHGPGPSCSDISGDIRNLQHQCPNGGVLQHYNGIGHKGTVFVAGINSTPAQPADYN